MTVRKLLACVSTVGCAVAFGSAPAAQASASPILLGKQVALTCKYAPWKEDKHKEHFWIKNTTASPVPKGKVVTVGFYIEPVVNGSVGPGDEIYKTTFPLDADLAPNEKVAFIASAPAGYDVELGGEKPCTASYTWLPVMPLNDDRTR